MKQLNQAILSVENPNMLSDNFIAKAQVKAQALKKRRQHAQEIIYFKGFCEENQFLLNANSKPDLVEIDRLSKKFIKDNNSTHTVNFILNNFQKYKYQLQLASVDESNEGLISFSPRRFEIIHMRVRQEEIAIVQAKKPRYKSTSNILKMTQLKKLQSFK
ncbi:hypothetical protein SS50377_27922 [Spironucleus salmonicida]|uniref:Uncharacterized protein n=1 Tax=Spironucleus salmonicida TaxID=348837 RepID=V6LP28_9EUKA|nr:hypothetical protein SS50377_27922 [Spironucleus salmonicida]|eukprot:EST42484.1 Hypothetical protein SS50377_17790 [Spironucleus salmonicida]